MTFLEPLPFYEALDLAQQKQLLPTNLSSAELRQLSADLRRRSVFSARVLDADFLQEIDELTERMAGGLREDFSVAGAPQAKGRESRMLSIAEAKAQLGEYLEKIGYEPENPDDIGTIKDLRTDARRQLIVETNVLDTMGYGQWRNGQDPVALDVNPGWRLTRFAERQVPRDWVARWQAARAATTAEGSTEGGDGVFIALRNHPIWQALGDGAGGYEDTLGNPWPPFAFHSGMGVIDVPRDECEALGLLGPATRIPAENLGLNRKLQASGNGFAEALQAQLARDPQLSLGPTGTLTLR